VLKVKVSTFIYRHLQGNPGRQRFTIEVAYWPALRQWQKWHSASSGSPLPEWTDLGPHSL